MTRVDAYAWIKALHVAAAITFVGGLLISALSLTTASGGSAGRAALLTIARRWDARVTTPAMVGTWGLGLGLALLGNWFPSGWLIAKLTIVVLLSGLHGVLSGRMRRLVSRGTGASVPSAPALVIIGAGLISVLVVVKPF